MANIAHSAPNADVESFRAQVALGSAGLGVIRGAASDQANLAGAAPAQILGVTDLDTNAAIGDVVSVRRRYSGKTAYVQAGAAVAVDALLTTNAAGLWITATTGQKAHARANAAAAASGDLFPVVFLDGDLSAP